MKLTWPIRFALGIPLAVGLPVWAAVRADHAAMRACFDEGRRIGGMEQRAFDAAANGEQPMKSDVDALEKGAPSSCR